MVNGALPLAGSGPAAGGLKGLGEGHVKRLGREIPIIGQAAVLPAESLSRQDWGGSR